MEWLKLNKLLDINEEPPVYRTKGSREKRRNSVVGTLHGSPEFHQNLLKEMEESGIYATASPHSAALQTENSFCKAAENERVSTLVRWASMQDCHMLCRHQRVTFT